MVQANSESVVRDSEFYKEDIVIQVENVLFRVDRGAFLQSTVFNDALSMPAGEGVECEGSSDARPFKLEGHSAEEFRHFLRILVPKQFELPVLTSDQWISVLKLATIWNFSAVRKIAIRNLDTNANDDPILRLIISKQYRVRQWLVPAVTALAARPDRMGLDDVRRLEVLGDRDMVLDLVLKIAGVREVYPSRKKKHAQSAITDIFQCNAQGQDLIYGVNGEIIGYDAGSESDSG